MKNVILGLVLLSSVPSFSAECLDETQKVNQKAFEAISKNINAYFLYQNKIAPEKCSITNYECIFPGSELEICTVMVKASGTQLLDESEDIVSARKVECEFKVIVDSSFSSEYDYRFIQGGCGPSSDRRE